MTTTITGISSMATRLILGELGQRFEAAEGVKVAIQAMGGVDAAKRVREGEATDIVILASGPMAKLEAEGHLVAGSVKGFTRSGMAIAVRSGAAPRRARRWRSGCLTPSSKPSWPAAAARAVRRARRCGRSSNRPPPDRPAGRRLGAGRPWAWPR